MCSTSTGRSSVVADGRLAAVGSPATGLPPHQCAAPRGLRGLGAAGAGRCSAAIGEKRGQVQFAEAAGWPLLAAPLSARALLFAVHPANSEAVCPVNFREDLLVTLATLVALWIASRFPAQRRWANVALGGGCLLATLAAVGSKENGAMIPAMLLAYWLMVRRRDPWRPWLILIAACGAVAVAFMAARFALEPQHSIIFAEKPGYLGGSFAEMVEIQPRSGLLNWLSSSGPDCCGRSDRVFHPLRRPAAGMGKPSHPDAHLGHGTWKNRGVGLGAAWFVLGLLPVSNLLPIYHPLADRYLYLPMLGVAMILGAVLSRVGIPARLGHAGFCGYRLEHAQSAGLSDCAAGHRLATSAFALARHHRPKPHVGHRLQQPRLRVLPPRRVLSGDRGVPRACQLKPDDADPWAGLAIAYDAMNHRKARPKPSTPPLVIRDMLIRRN